MTKEECFMCGGTPMHYSGLSMKAVCCECWGDCGHGKQN
jgi:hypothetical protein